ncbi:MAG: arsenic resistance N-acetyltransferase ArsN2 [Opitutaceae bacterium]|nr:arsenic resistance N-acetyltransferase ArsN2 [Opitutaceae bacterium]
MPALPAIAPAVAADAGAIAALLHEAGLPHVDIAPHLGHFLVARAADGSAAGAIGAEVHGDDALLRSFVVAPPWRSQGLGRALLATLEHTAGEWGVSRWWLLTTTAADYFSAQGFQAVARSNAPPAIAATGEFRVLCPASASCWSRERRGP